VETYFRGRQEERERVARRWGQRAPARTVVIAPAGGGKRSLVNATTRDVGQEVTPIRVRLDRLLPENGHGLARALIDAINLRHPHPALPRLARQLKYGPPEVPGMVLRELAEPLAKVPGRALVVLEGAHGLARLPEETLGALNDLAASSRAHFACLVDHLNPTLQERLPNLLGTTGTRFTRLDPLSRRDAGVFLQDRFEAAGARLEMDALHLMLEYAGGDPRGLQLLGARTYDVMLRSGRFRVTEEEVAQGLYLTLESLPPEWTRILGRLEGRARDAFVALALLEKPTVSAIGERIDLDPKNVCVVLARLAERGAPIEKTGRGRWRISHRLLAEWVRKEWTLTG
jgi:hypothetical protein